MVRVSREGLDDAQGDMAVTRSGTFGQVEMTQRVGDGYVNATAICRQLNKKLNHYLENQGTKELIEALAIDAGIPASILVQVRKGGAEAGVKGAGQGTWLHPDLACDLARWACPKFALQVARWVREILTTGNATRDGQPPSPAVGSAEFRALVTAIVQEAVAPVLAQIGTGPRLPGPFWTVASWLEENMPEWDTTRAQRHQIGQDAKRRVTRAFPKEQVGYFNRDLAFLAHQEIHLCRAAQRAYRKAVRENKMRSAPHLFSEAA